MSEATEATSATKAYAARGVFGMLAIRTRPAATGRVVASVYPSSSTRATCVMKESRPARPSPQARVSSTGPTSPKSSASTATTTVSTTAKTNAPGRYLSTPATSGRDSVRSTAAPSWRAGDSGRTRA
jgi:hypothetical protein